MNKTAHYVGDGSALWLKVASQQEKRTNILTGTVLPDLSNEQKQTLGTVPAPTITSAALHIDTT